MCVLTRVLCVVWCVRFYGDFFVPAAQYKSSICYTGIYRFLNNPDCVTGYAGQYGLALICRSWVLFALAATSHLAHIAFLNLVEIPHMHKLYGDAELRGEGPLPKALGKVTQTVSASIVPPTVRQAQRKMNAHLQAEIRRVRVAALTEMFELYQRMDTLRGKQPHDASLVAGQSAAVSPIPPSRSSAQLHNGHSVDGDGDLSELNGADDASGEWEESAESGGSAEVSPRARTADGQPPRYMLNVPTQCRVGQPITVHFTTQLVSAAHGTAQHSSTPAPLAQSRVDE